MIKAIIFDCFGVLVGTGFSDTYRHAGGDPAKDRDFIQQTLDDSNIGKISSEEMSVLMADKIGISVVQWNTALLEAEQVNSEILEYIANLKKSYKVAVLSNVSKGTLEERLSKEQLGMFNVVIGSAEVGMIKPDPQIYRYAAEQLGVQPTECVFTDDIQAYCNGATSVGMTAIRYQDFGQFKQQLEKLLADSNH